MITIKKGQDKKETISFINDVLEKSNLKSRTIRGESRTVVAVIGEEFGQSDLFQYLSSLPFVEKAEPIQTNDGYKLVSRDNHEDFINNLKTFEFYVDGVKIGNGKPTIISGPCAIQSRDQTLSIAKSVAESGADILRGGAYKPRSSPYAFQGMGERGLEILAEAKKECGLPIMSEVTRPDLVSIVGSVVDILQIGARNMGNFELLKEVANYASKNNKAVLLKTSHECPTLNSVLQSAEYIVAGGVDKLIICERGVSLGTAPGMRNNPRPSFLYALREKCPYPIFGDPSHAIGRRDLVPATANGYLDHKANGLAIEVWNESMGPRINNELVCDAKQSLNFEQFKAYMDHINKREVL